jgi:tRNA (cytidine/uridine-2'-O-)-methyltransferase
VLDIALYQPEIPPNTGNIIRLCANTGSNLHLIHPLGFTLDDKRLRRAGLDYHDLALVSEHTDLAHFLQVMQGRRLLAITTRGQLNHSDFQFRQGDVLVMGAETRGLPEEFLASLPAGQCLKIPMRPNSRSLNLSNATAVVVYEAWRQLGFRE